MQAPFSLFTPPSAARTFTPHSSLMAFCVHVHKSHVASQHWLLWFLPSASSSVALMRYFLEILEIKFISLFTFLFATQKSVSYSTSCALYSNTSIINCNFWFNQSMGLQKGVFICRFYLIHSNSSLIHWIIGSCFSHHNNKGICYKTENKKSTGGGYLPTVQMKKNIQMISIVCQRWSSSLLCSWWTTP